MSQSPGAALPQHPEPIGARTAGPSLAQPERPYIPPQNLQPPTPPRGGDSALKPISLGLLLGTVILAIMVAVQLVRPLPAPDVDLTMTTSHTFAGQAPTLPWPTRAGQASIDVAGVGTMGSTGSETPTPTASVAKVMTAYIFLKDHPLKAGDNGPTFTISPEEAARLKDRISRDESHINVTANEPFTERQALEALLVVSANNIAHEMARWDAGGDQAFVAKMNATARKLGMAHTTYTDPSGYDASTVSTAADQVKLLRAAMTLPGFEDAASQPTFSVPQGNDPPRRSTNALLGVDGVVAGKTGYTSAAGGNFVFAARKTVDGVTVLIVGAVMNQSGVPSSEPTVASAKPLIEAAEQELTADPITDKGRQIGNVDDRLGDKTPFTASAPIVAVGWPGLTVRLTLHSDAHIPHHAASGTRLGTLGLGSGVDAPQLPIVLSSDLDTPTITHRIARLS